MAITWVIIGSIGQLMVAMFLFMLVAFSAGGIANGNSLSKRQMSVLNLSIYALPATCLLSAGIVIYFYCTGASVIAFWWHLLPLGATVAYLLFVSTIGGTNKR